MPILAIRHAISEANNRDNIGTPLFGSPDAPLFRPLAEEQAAKAAAELRGVYGVDIATTPVAVSRFARTQETAEAIGFKTRNPNKLLNEVEHGMGRAEWKEARAARRLPPAALRAARAILAKPPPEQVWFAHGLIIAALTHELEVHDKFELFIPYFCEIRALPIERT